MDSKPIDVLAVGNAIVDIFGRVNDQFLIENGVQKNLMNLVDADTLRILLQSLTLVTLPEFLAGGSAANTAVGINYFGGNSSFVGRVFDDDLGRMFQQELIKTGVNYPQPLQTDGSPTASSIILVTPDAARSMNTYLGSCLEFDPEDLGFTNFNSVKIVYLEGYLYDAPKGPEVFTQAASMAQVSGTKIALSLSDPWCVERHRDALSKFISKHVDILLGNEEEVISLCQCSRDDAIEKLSRQIDEVIVTLGPDGAIIRANNEQDLVPSMPQGPVIDTTGAGDLFSAGYLYGRTHGYDSLRAGQLGSLAAGEVIGHIGARPEADLKLLAARLLSR